MVKILLIEDDPLIYRLYQKLFTLEGFEIELADNGQAGLDKLKGFKADIILLDIMMPDMNGMELLSAIKGDPATKDVPVVVLTNMAEQEVSQMAVEKGAVMCLIKSQLEPEEVVGWVKSVLKKFGQPEAPVSAPPGS